MTKIGIIGGTGPEGRGLAIRWLLAGHNVLLGSRSAERAQEAADRVREIVPPGTISGSGNLTVSAEADVLIVAVPADALDQTVKPLTDRLVQKVVVSVVASLDWTDGRPKPLWLPEGSAAEKIQALLPMSFVTSGFQTLSAAKLANPSEELDEDCLVCGDDRDARRQTMNLAADIGVRPISAGKLENSFYPEVMVGLLAALNRIHKAHTGLRVVGMSKS